MEQAKISELAKLITRTNVSQFSQTGIDTKEAIILQLLMKKMPPPPVSEEEIRQILNKLFESNQRFGQIVMEIWEKKGSQFPAMISIAKRG